MFYNLVCKSYIALSRIFDKKCGKNVDFAQWVSKKELNINKEGNQYMPSTFTLKKVLKKLKVNSKDNILDVGCGKGKAMYIMSHFPFKNIHGIDLSDHLVKIANKNFDILKKNQCRAICCNALDYANYDHYSMFYFYNPFPKEVFHKVIAKIVESYKKHPRKLTLIYMNAVCEDEILSTKKFRRIYIKKSFISWFQINCYESV